MRTKVAVLGGGCGGLSAAAALTATPELRDRFEVTVYQLGHRLGGKGASGRAELDGHAARIEEHGLHIWFGFYDHAFRLLRQAYEEAGLSAGEDWWTLPFAKCNAVSLYERRRDGSWVRQPVTLPTRGGARSGPPTAPRRPPLSRVVAATVRMLAMGLRAELQGGGPVRRGAGDDMDDPLLADMTATMDELAAELEDGPDEVALGSDETVRSGAVRGPRVDALVERINETSLEALIEKLRSLVQNLSAAAAPGSRGPESSWSDRLSLWSGALETMAASVAGLVRDGVFWHGLSVIDGEDLRDWLVRHGASREVVDRSSVLRGLYDLTFAYLDGDKRTPSLAAGKGLQAMLMMINYEGAFMWRMRAGMGDVVFSPLYLALRERGVSFHFFTRATALHLDESQHTVESIDLEREATVAAGPDAYLPVKRMGDWWCWPSDAYVDQLVDSEPRAEVLRRGVDFDQLVLAVPVGAQHELCAELAQASPRYRQMLEGVRTVRTKALQLWLTRTVDELRARDDGDLDAPATAFAEPFDTYCDMSHLLPAELAGDEGPRGVAYFCAVLPDEVSEEEALAKVRELALLYIQGQAQTFWPGAFGPDGFDWEVLFDPIGRVGPDRLAAQYLRANTSGSDRYVITAAGSVEHRLDPGDSGFANVVLAGDWTHNDIDGGCVEAAVISGERAAQALIER